MKISISLIPDYAQNDVVLVEMDNDGAEELIRVFQGSIQRGNYKLDAAGCPPLNIEVNEGQQISSFSIFDQAWNLSTNLDKAEEIILKISVLLKASVPCHHYVDISFPVDTLLLSYCE